MKPSPAVFFPIPEFCWASAIAQGAFEVDGQTCYARQLFDNVLFRFDDPADVSRTLFLTRKLAEGEKVGLYADEAFATQVREGEIGRFVVYRSPSAKNCCIALFFRPGGTGFFQDKKGYGDAKEDDEIPFIWNAQDAGLASASDVFIVPEERLLPLCERVYVKQIWPAMRDPHPTADAFPTERLRFVRGSRADLVRLTRAACRIDVDLIAEQEEDSEKLEYVAIRESEVASVSAFIAELPKRIAHWPDSYVGPVHDCYAKARTRPILRLAHACNLFTGGHWEYAGQWMSGKRSERYRFVERRISVSIPSEPSAHERIEAYLELSEWLEGKVTPEEKAELLGMQANSFAPVG